MAQLHWIVSLASCLTLVACQPAARETADAPASPAPASSAKAVTPEPAQALPTTAESPAPALVRVTDPSSVCMVNNRYMGVPQIPVQVDGKTYYGCCAMCEKRLREEPAARQGIDPVSQKPVDKALALMARDEGGRIFYFESEASLAKGGVRL